jgi:DNA-binding IclR family transcriptional regulator
MSTDTGAAEKYISDSQQRLLRMVMALAGHEVNGLAPGQIAKLADCSPSQATRDLANLQAAGWAEQVPDLRTWRLGPAPVRLALAHMAGMDRVQRRMGEVRSRFGAGAGA